MKLKIILALLLLLSMTSVHADGHQLLKECQDGLKMLEMGENPTVQFSKTLPITSMRCFGIVQGVRHTMRIYSDGEYVKDEHKLCFPKKSINNFEGAKVVVKFLTDNPFMLEHEDVGIAFVAFREYYKCNPVSSD